MNQRLIPLMTICKTKQVTLARKIKIILNLNPQELLILAQKMKVTLNPLNLTLIWIIFFSRSHETPTQTRNYSY